MGKVSEAPLAFGVRACDHLWAWLNSLPDATTDSDGWAAYQAYQNAVLIVIWPAIQEDK